MLCTGTSSSGTTISCWLTEWSETWAWRWASVSKCWPRCCTMLHLASENWPSWIQLPGTNCKFYTWELSSSCHDLSCRYTYFKIFIEQSSLPEQFIKGLTTASLQGRAQIVPDQHIDIESPGDLVFYLDGAHSPESMEVCAGWFSLAIKEDSQRQNLNYQPQDNSRSSHELIQRHPGERSRKNSTQVEHRTLNVVRSKLFGRSLEKTKVEK